MSSNDPTKAYQNSPGGQAYQNIPSPGSPTQTEAWALIEAARRMAVAIEAGPFEEAQNRRDLRETLRLNWRLWTIFQAHLTTDGGDVPPEIRENMLTLCQFVDNHTVDTMTNPTPEKVATLINLNREIASGLFESQQAGLEAEAAAGDAGTEQQDQGDAEEAADPHKPFSIGV